MPETVVLLHGFAGTGRGWDLVVERLDAQRYTALAPDLRGHGSARDVRPITFDACVADVLVASPPRFDLCGYSMGGRIALHVALAAPERVRRLVLVATTAGIEEVGERAARREADGKLAAEIEGEPIESFADRWLAQALFDADAPDVAARAREDIVRNDTVSLAAALRGIGTGGMEPLWNRLGELTMPALVVAGECDAKFRAIAERLVAALPAARIVVVPAAGHALPREAPGGVAAAIQA